MISTVALFLAPILTIFVSMIYFCMSPKEQPLHIRFAVSGNGVTIFVLYCSAILISQLMNISPPIKNTIYEIWSYLLIIPVILMFYSLVKFRGPLWVHALQFINMIGVVWTFLLGSMFLSDTWK